MRILSIVACIFLVAACARPSSSLGLADLTRAAGDGLKEYYEWVKEDDTKFPNALCFAGIVFEVKLSDTKTTSASASLPLAGPTPGITSLFGWSLSVTEENVGVVTVPMYATYQEDPQTDKNLISEEFKKFIEDIPNLRDKLGVGSREGGEIRLPPGAKTESFYGRTDLAAELWTIREAIHEMVLNSPEGIVLTPGELPIVHEYRVTTDSKGSAQISLASKGAGSLSAGRKVTDHNRMGIFFTENQSADKMRCDSKSVPKNVAKGLTLPKL